MSTTAMPAAGWYANPEGPGQRYWDGIHWTEHINEAAPPPPPVATSAKEGNGLAVAALVFGLVGILIGGAMNILFFLGWGFGVTALVLGLLGRRRQYRRTMATWGVVLGIASFAIGIYGASQVNKAVNDLNTTSQQLDSYSTCVQNAQTLADMEQC
jgi:Protein of unknown function (DUF2510)/Predicted membrane protein (DUF2232)